MMIAFVGATSNAKLTSLTLELTPHASTVNGHVMLAVVTVRTPNLADNAITPPAGWSLVDGTYDAGSPGVRTDVYVRVASSEGAEYAWTFASSNEACGSLLTYSGVDTSAPVLVSAAIGQASGSVTRTTPDINVTLPDCWTVSYFADRSGSTWVGPDTERVEVKAPATSASQVVCDSAAGVATGLTSRSATASASTSVAEQGILALQPTVIPSGPSVVQEWTAAGSQEDLRVVVNPTAGNWLIVTLAYRTADGTAPLATVGDLAANWWVLCGSSVSADAAWRVEVWACPNVVWAPWVWDIVYSAVSHIHATDTGSLLVHIAEVTGFTNGYPTISALQVGTALAASSLSIVMPTPAGGANSWCLSVAATNNTTKTISITSAGWTALTQVSRAGPDLEMAPAWRDTTTTQTASWAVDTGTADWVGIVVALQETGTEWDQPNPNWPAMRVQFGRGHGLETPLPRVGWTDETLRVALLDATRGLQHELGRPQAGEATIKLRNHDDQVTPSAGGDIDIYTPYQVLAAWAGKIYPLISGWGEAYKRWWDDAHAGYVDVDGVDAIATLIQDVPSPIRGEILRHDPYAYWPLGDASGSASALNVARRSSAPLTVARSKFGIAASSADFGGTIEDLRGDPGTGWAQSGLVNADVGKGSALIARDDNFPAIADGITVLGFTAIESASFSTQPNNDITLFIIRDLGAYGGQGSTILKLSVDRSLALPELTVWDKDTGIATATQGANNMAQTRPIPWAVRFTRTSWRVDHTSMGVGSFTGSADLPANFQTISVGGEADEWWNGNCGNATHAHVAVLDRWLTNEEVDQFMSEAALGWLGSERTNLRLQRSLATAGVSSPRVIDNSTVRMSADGRDGGILAQRAADVADYEAGLLFGDAAGYLRFRSQARSYQQNVRWVLGDDTANGEIPFAPALSPAFEPTYLFNHVTVDNHGESTLRQAALASSKYLSEQWLDKKHIAVDAASRERHNERPMSRETWLYDQPNAYGLAEWLLALYRQPRQRVAQAVVSAAAYPAAWPLVLGVEVGDLITVIRRPIGQAAITIPCRVMQIKTTLLFGEGGTEAAVSLSLAAAPPQVLVCGSGRTLGTSTIGW